MVISCFSLMLVRHARLVPGIHVFLALTSKRWMAGIG